MNSRLVQLWEETRYNIRIELTKNFRNIYTYNDLLEIMLKEFSKALGNYEWEWDEDDHGIVVQKYGSYSGDLLLVYSIYGKDEILSTTHYSGVFICIMGYGSCSGCDALLHALDERENEGVDELMQICLYIIQRSKKLCDLWRE